MLSCVRSAGFSICVWPSRRDRLERPERVRFGFTLVELLVVIAIIAVLVALLLPAVQAAREAARRAQCLNNLKQLALAIQNFNSASNRFPDSHDYDSKSSRGWTCLILPFMEEQGRYDVMKPYFKGSFSAATGINHPALANVVDQPIAGFRCPTDASASEATSTQQYQWTGQAIALTNYKGTIGDTKMGGVGRGSPDCHVTANCPGFFWRYSYLRIIRCKHVKDGLSKTFIAGEDLPRYNYHSSLYHGNGTYSSTHVALNYKPEPPRPITWPTAISFRSDHNGGAQFAYVDGAVIFVSDLIDFKAYQALSTKAGGETVQIDIP